MNFFYVIFYYSNCPTGILKLIESPHLPNDNSVQAFEYMAPDAMARTMQVTNNLHLPIRNACVSNELIAALKF